MQTTYTQSLNLSCTDGQYSLTWVVTDFRAMMSIVDAIVALERKGPGDGHEVRAGTGTWPARDQPAVAKDTK